VTLEDESYPCWQTISHGLSCSKSSVETWQAFELLNRPAILTVVKPDKNLAFSLIIGTTESDVHTIDPQGYIQTQSKEELGKIWNGDLVYLWRKPEEFSIALSEGMRSPVIAWIAKQFAALDGQDTPITRQTFTSRLKTRIQIFQSNNGLENDGVIGERTIMKLNERLGISPILIHSLPQNDQES